VAGGRTRSAVVAVSTVLACAVAVAGAKAHPFSDWTGKSGPFRWHADMVSCGAVPGEPNRIEAHTRWVDSPNNGYQRVSFRRQIRNEAATSWKTVASQTRSTKNTLEGLDVLLHWTQSFLPASSEEGRTSRDVLQFAWRRDREGSDRTVFARRVVLGPCVVG
jgi:hypothetical protein